MTLSKIGVIGAGTMGNGIAQVSAAAGLQVVMVDVSEAALDRGLAAISGSLDRLVKKHKLSADDHAAVRSRIRGSIHYRELAAVDLVIEAATENAEVKRRIMQQADEIMRPEAILATNTSSISITALAAATTRADRVVGMHFFNPVPLMALVELIRGLLTSEQTHAHAAQFIAQIGKTAINAKNSPGFAVNRVLCPMINEAIFAVYEGVASIDAIDTVMKLGMHHPMGPLTLADFIGLDTCLAIMNVLYDGFGDSKYRACPLLKQYVAAGWLGKKSGRGFYDYRGTVTVPAVV